jgi:hypothetical protein
MVYHTVFRCERVCQAEVGDFRSDRLDHTGGFDAEGKWKRRIDFSVTEHRIDEVDTDRLLSEPDLLAARLSHRGFLIAEH